ncbi:hypothetical protein BGW36DRAFT_318805 [Talaromyces proteolyticus]|uniref:Ubiquitin-like domain-containing protein n=1 Tax=Talaromyces proteolyticus TaxID=1131652 RepID=A0AAD4KRX9_9EURO|nr:uncharacterized protein BGW36DRAFT_318805 [Talaromyces proteolyticus]KAH8699050.1 hypothetical protein BGW36DRAFT_318805 [Talaromyces proteolyticus]
MESSKPGSTSLPGEGEVSSSVSLRILSPSFESNRGLSLDNLALSTTIRDVKKRLTPLVPGNPTPDQQRLIHRGKPLLDPNATLKDFLGPPFDIAHTLHLVLPPGPEASSNFNTNADGTLRYRNISSHVSSRATSNSPDPSTHTPGSTGISPEPTSLSTGAQVQGRIPNHQPQPGINISINPPLDAGQRPRDLRSTLEHIEQTRRQADGLNQAVDRARTLLNAHAVRMRIQNVNTQWVNNTNQPGQQPRPSPTPTVNLPGSTSTLPNPHQLWSNGAAQNLLIARIASQIISLELEIQRGNAPAIDNIVRIRGQLYAMLDARYRQPNLAISSEVEGLLLRLQNIYTRAYQIRQMEHLRQVPPVASYAGGAVQIVQSSGHYLATGPSGEQMILTPSGTPQPQISNIPFQNTQPSANDPAGGAVPNAEMQNIVRQAILNQPEARGGGNGNDNFAQNVRRFWLFLRLYFFCYLFTNSGTWERFFFVGMAAFIAFFSESTITRRFFEMVVEPVQRHLEGLIHGQPPAPSPQQRGDNNSQPEQPRIPAGGAEHGWRRIERAIALFLASLIPGVGERQVEVRNAAEEAARNAEQQAREEEERARNEAQNAENPNSNGLSEPSTTERSSNVDQNEQQQHA